MRRISIEDVKDANRRHGGHWFSPFNMRFFRSRVGECAYLKGNGSQAFFVSSERFSNDTPREYTVRVCDLDTGDIQDASKFQQYASRSGADKAARRLAS